MAKGRKLTTSQSDRFLGSYGYSQSQGTITDVSEFDEEDVWSIVDNMANGGDWSPSATHDNNRYVSVIDGPRIPRGGDGRHVGGLSLAFDDSGKTLSSRVVHQFRGQDCAVASPRVRHMATSAPLNVPDWSRIYRVDSVESLHGSDDDDDMVDHESETVPPHEYLAREYSRSRNAAANSVFEGVGRTLKGRDLSRVRDAVWGQTGFNG